MRRHVCALLTLMLVAAGCKEKAAKPVPPEVMVMPVEAKDVPIYGEWIGAIDGYVNAGIRAQVSGYLQVQDYKEGAEVKKGDQLFQIDPRPFQATLDQAKAKLAQDKATEGKTELDVKRYTPLVKEQAISQEDLDNAVQANLSAVSQVKADEAAIESAQLNLDFTKITSPIDGVAGTALAQVGDLVSPSSGLLTTVSTLDPIRVYFNPNEQSYLNFWRARLVHGGDDPLELDLVLSDGSTYPLKGKFFFADRQVNPNTGTLQMAGVFPNPDRLLRPGQYGRVRAQLSLHRGALLVPQRAVAELQGAYQVSVVQNENSTNYLRVKNVKVGEQLGADWIIEDGLKVGDQIVVEGTLKAKDGTVVTPKPYSSKTNSQPSGQVSNDAPATAQASTNKN
jgi:membrane fusion protein, multidrug efflux system